MPVVQLVSLCDKRNIGMEYLNSVLFAAVTNTYIFFSNKELSTVLCSVVKHAGGGDSTKEV